MSEKKIDHAALIAEARGYQSFAFDAEETGYALIIRALADALEAAQPQGEYHEGLEEGIKIGRAETAQQAPRTSVQEVLELLDAFHGDNRMSYDAYANLHDAVALLDVQQAPAVDREALARWHSPAAWREPHYPHTFREDMRNASLAAVDELIASGILLDAAKVEARGLEKGAMLCDDKWGEFAYIDSQGVIGYATVPEILNQAARQVREGEK